MPAHPKKQTIRQWRALVEETSDFEKPFMQPIYIDLHEDVIFKPEPIHLSFRLGINSLIHYLDTLRSIGVNHLALNLRLNTMDMNKTLELIAKEILPEFHSTKQTLL